MFSGLIVEFISEKIKNNKTIRVISIIAFLFILLVVASLLIIWINQHASVKITAPTKGEEISGFRYIVRGDLLTCL